MSLFANAFHAALNETGTTFRAWSEAAGVNYRTAHHCLNRGSQPNDKLLRAFVSKWPRPEIGINILRAYLRDEVRRAGFSAEDVEVLLPGELPGPSLDKDLVTLREYLLKHPDLAGALKSMARIAREEMTAGKIPYKILGKPLQRVAEDKTGKN
ncbi:MAG TPA: hypothetical protein VHC95_06910 [Opitutales bacterium]|nr:hypothetical protein [Opitutales bacterium]